MLILAVMSQQSVLLRTSDVSATSDVKQYSPHHSFHPDFWAVSHHPNLFSIIQTLVRNGDEGLVTMLPSRFCRIALS